MSNAAQADRIAAAVNAALGVVPTAVELLAGGRNNVGARVDLGRERLFAKAYFGHPSDTRDRAGTEFSMLAFLGHHGVCSVPRAIALDRDRQVGFYTWIEGRRPTPGEVTEADVADLTRLLGRMWELRLAEEAATLPEASDSSFSLQSYLWHVGRRLDTLAAAWGISNPLAGDLAAHLERLRGALGRASQRLAKGAADAEWDTAVTLGTTERTISPADHGFANSLRVPGGGLAFIDFEYAGWDDPAQMVGNACLQPEVPLPEPLQGAFVREMTARLGLGKDFLRRLRLVYPVMALKWCLIMLNEFLPVDSARRGFAGAPAESRRAAQLAKSRAMLSRVEAMLAKDNALEPLVGEAEAAVRG